VNMKIPQLLSLCSRFRGEVVYHEKLGWENPTDCSDVASQHPATFRIVDVGRCCGRVN
jgi:hypothetical protein